MNKIWFLGALLALSVAIGVPALVESEVLPPEVTEVVAEIDADLTGEAFATVYMGYRVYTVDSPPGTIEVYPEGEPPLPGVNISSFELDVNCETGHITIGDRVHLIDWGDPGDGDVDQIYVVM